MSEVSTKLYRIEDDLSGDLVAVLAAEDVAEIERNLAKHAAFVLWLANREQIPADQVEV